MKTNDDFCLYLIDTWWAPGANRCYSYCSLTVCNNIQHMTMMLW